MKNVNKVNLLSDIKEAINVALFKEKAMHNVAEDKNKNISALLVLAVAALASAIGNQMFGGFFAPSLSTSLVMIIYQVVLSVIGIFVLSLIAKVIFKGSAKHDSFFRVMAFGMIISWITIVPMLGIISALWGLVLVFVILKTVHKLTTGGVIGTILVSIVVFMLLSLILAPIMVIFGIRGYGASFNKKVNLEDVYKKGFEMNFEDEDGAGSFEMEDGNVTIKGPDGEVMKISIPGIE